MEDKYDQRYLQELRELLFAQARSYAQALGEAGRRPGGLQNRPCPACGARPPERPLWTSAYPRFVACDDCGLRFQTPLPPEPELEAVLGFNDSNPIMRRYWELRLSRLPPSKAAESADNPQLRDITRRKKGGRLLDVGCGLGEFLQKASSAFQAEGIELNPRLRESARARGAAVLSLRLEELPPEPVYDVITFQQLLYGLLDPLSLMREARRRLKNDGLLYINTPNADSWAVQVFGARHCHFLCPNLNVFNLSSLCRLARRAGLRVVDWRTEWLDIYLGDLVARWMFPARFLHRRNSFMPFYRQINALIDRLDRRWLAGHLGRKGDYLIAVLEPI